MSLQNDKEYLIEYTTVGNAVKITAMDPETGIEVSTMGPSYMSRDLMAKAAINKLEYKIRKLSDNTKA